MAETTKKTLNQSKHNTKNLALRYGLEINKALGFALCCISHDHTCHATFSTSHSQQFVNQYILKCSWPFVVLSLSIQTVYSVLYKCVAVCSLIFEHTSHLQCSCPSIKVIEK